MNTEKDSQTLAAAGGVPPEQVTYKNEILFDLPDSGKEVRMRKPMVADSIQALKDKSIDHDNYVESLLATVSLICTFDGKPVNVHQLKAELSLIDYNFIARQYMDLIEPGKSQSN